MYCRNCGRQLQENAVVCLGCGVQAGTGVKFCSNCGKEVDPLAVVCVSCGAQLKEMTGTSGKHPLHPVIARVKENAIDKIVDFKGRMSRREYWWWMLSAAVMATVLMFIPFVGWLAALGLCLPMVSATVRRLHDVGRPTLNILFGLIPFVGMVLMIIWCVDPGMSGDNEFGPEPKK